ncbi:hypothetical protein ACO22_05151 [Paracoccidioides brasiliensis]|uniref:Uncharacterized protein n=1 Tax=Paracoccidioides brasiliensis TaxID=121759 RepID=A0A1D2JB46_PARBR|nr:hypothetical protein ACO22_05151 [Paracoccidioides brasiliensis]
MNLRNRNFIKPPRRYDEVYAKPAPLPVHDEPRVYKPKSDPTRPAFPIPFTDFNPNLPPAAFPTLDFLKRSLTPEQRTLEHLNNTTSRVQGHSGAKKYNSENVTDGIGRSKCDYSHEHKHKTTKGSFLLTETESNPDNDNLPGDVDHQDWSDTMGYLHGAESSPETMSARMALSDDENEVGIGASEAAGTSGDSLRPGKWSDISQVLQTEIFDNLRSVYEYRKVVDKLRLTPTEQVKMIEHSSSREEQIKNENELLQEMRKKQLQALMRMDNSYLRTQQVPAQLVFQTISNKCLGDTITNAEPDYSMTRASDILIARKYLRSCGLDPKFAGEWGNNLVTINSNGSTGEDANADTTESFEWTGELPQAMETDVPEQGKTNYESRQGSEATPDDSSQSDCSPTPKQLRSIDSNLNAAQQILRHRQEAALSRPGATQPLANRTSGARNGSPLWTQPSNPYQGTRQPSPLRQESVVRLKVGPQGAARIQQGLFRVQGDMMALSSLAPRTGVSGNIMSKTNLSSQSALFGNMESLSGSELLSQHWIEQLKSSKKRGCDTLKRSLAGSWYYGKSKKETEAASRASRLLRDRLEAARAEAESSRLEDLRHAAGPESIPPVPGVNLHIPSQDDAHHVAHADCLCKCQVLRGKRMVSSPKAQTSGQGGPQANQQMPFNSELNLVQQITPSSRPNMEKEAPELSSITPTLTETPCEPKENELMNGKSAGHGAHLMEMSIKQLPGGTATWTNQKNAKIEGNVAIATLPFRMNASNASSKQEATQAGTETSATPFMPVPELEMMDVSCESNVMETDNAQNNQGPESIELDPLVSPARNNGLFGPEARLPNAPKEKLPVPESLSVTKPLKKKNRKSGNGWTKKKPSRDTVGPVKRTTAQVTKKQGVKSNVSKPEMPNTRAIRRSGRIIKKTA